MLSILSKVDTEASAHRPASTWSVADDGAQGPINKCAENLRIHDTIVLSKEY